MNARTQITMDAELQRRAHAKAAELGLSFAEYVRRLVARDLGEPRRNTHISLVFDLGASREPTDIARDKDQMLGEAMWAEHVRKTARKSSRPHRRARSAAVRR
jgi:ribonuclease BN (tRNA processing enzyme)